MSTLALPEAAALLKVAPGTLRKRAAAGMVPGYKPGKGWVFIEEELLAYLKSTRPCPSIVDVIRPSGGVVSSSTGGKYASLLARRIASRRKRLKRSHDHGHTKTSGLVIDLTTHGRKPPAGG